VSPAESARTLRQQQPAVMATFRIVGTLTLASYTVALPPLHSDCVVTAGDELEAWQ